MGGRSGRGILVGDWTWDWTLLDVDCSRVESLEDLCNLYIFYLKSWFPEEVSVRCDAECSSFTSDL